MLALDTPRRDSLLYRCGEFAYRVTRGRITAVLGGQYSAEAFGHKQIFADAEMSAMLDSLGFSSVSFQRIHELSFPYHVYLRRMLRSRAAARAASPLAALVFRLVHIRNKMVVVACRW